MKINAYILTADPAHLESSISSYYDIVDKLVVSYDESHTSFTGKPLDKVEQCLQRLRVLDVKEKMVFMPGHYARLDHTPMDNETHQRRCALEEARQGADWILQFDTDEILPDSAEFLSCLNEAATKDYSALNYPSRWLYKELSDGRYLEQCSRFWRLISSYPGPLAIRNDVNLRLARQGDLPYEASFHVDIRPKSTDPWRSAAVEVHRVIRPEQAVIHYSMVRDEEDLRQKTQSWSHAKDRDWSPEIRDWMWSGRHPYRTMLRTPLIRNSSTRKRLRISRIDDARFKKLVSATAPLEAKIETATAQ